MNILSRYIAKYIMIATILVMLVVASLTFIISLLGELRDIGIGDYGFTQAIIHSLFQLPHNLYNFFPMVILLGTMMGLGTLSYHQELIAMRTSGFSIRHITCAVMLTACLFIFISSMIGEWVSPSATYLANKRKDSEQNSGQVIATTAGIWVHQENNFLHINRVVDQHHLEGVTRYAFDTKHRLLAVYYSKKIDFQNHHWIDHDRVETRFKSNQTQTRYSTKVMSEVMFHPALFSIGLIEPSEMSLSHLFKSSQRLKENGIQAGYFQWEFWKRIFQPLTSLVMVLLAIPFVFNAPRSISMGRRMMTGALIGIIFYILNSLMGQLSIVLQLPPALGALLPTVLIGMWAAVALNRTV